MIIDESNYEDFLRGRNQTLDCTSKGITEIRYLPNYIESLYCHDNKITSLPKLPDGLKKLICHQNRLSSLPEIPDTLVILYCSMNPKLLGGGVYRKNNEYIQEYYNKLLIKDKLKEFLL